MPIVMAWVIDTDESCASLDSALHWTILPFLNIYLLRYAPIDVPSSSHILTCGCLTICVSPTMLRQRFGGIACSAFGRVLSRSFAALPSQADPLPSTKPQLPDFDYAPKPYTGPSYEEVHQLRRAHISKTIFTFYKKPLMLVEGKQQYLYDESGRRYLDGIAGIATVSVGHCHPTVVSAIQKQVSNTHDALSLCP